MIFDLRQKIPFQMFWKGILIPFSGNLLCDFLHDWRGNERFCVDRL